MDEPLVSETFPPGVSTTDEVLVTGLPFSSSFIFCSLSMSSNGVSSDCSELVAMTSPASLVVTESVLLAAPTGITIEALT